MLASAERLARFLGCFVAIAWGAVLIYFYESERLLTYLTGRGIFRELVIVAGVLLIVVGLFNLITLRRVVACGHDHGDHDHDHAGCGHDHGISDHDHEKCDHEHAHDDHKSCDHEHGEHDHDHHDCGHDHHDEDDGHHHSFFGGDTLGSTVMATVLLLLPLLFAAARSPDAYSPRAIANKGLYNPNYESSRSDISLGSMSSRTKSASRPTGPGTDIPQPEGLTMLDQPPSWESSDSDSTAAADTPPAEGQFSMEDLEAQVDRDAEGFFLLEVPEIYYTAGDKEVRRVLEGQPVTTIAQVMPERLNNPNGTRARIFRLFIECCAADARPLSIPVEFGGPAPEFQEMGWVEVRGTMTYKMEGGVTVPILNAGSMIPTDEPDSTMMY